MVKKFSYIVISLAILAAGYFAVTRLNYWERSIRIFKMNSDQPFEGRMGRGSGGFEGRGDFEGRAGIGRQQGSREGFERPAMRELPDSIRARFEAEGGRQMMRNRNVPDSLRQQFRQPGGERFERGSFDGGMRGGQGHGRGELPGGKKINLRNVVWFLAVFASFTVIAIYLDKAAKLIRKQRTGTKDFQC